MLRFGLDRSLNSFQETRATPHPSAHAAGIEPQPLGSRAAVRYSHFLAKNRLGGIVGDRLRLDPEQLVQLGHDLRAVASEFDTAQTGADYIANAVGHDGLAEKVRGFAKGWDDRRAKMLDSIANLAQAAGDSGEAFKELDSELAAALLGEK